MPGPSRRGLLLLLVLVYDVAVAFNSPSWALQQRQPVESRRNNALHGGTATEEELDLETERPVKPPPRSVSLGGYTAPPELVTWQRRLECAMRRGGAK